MLAVEGRHYRSSSDSHSSSESLAIRPDTRIESVTVSTGIESETVSTGVVLESLTVPTGTTVESTTAAPRQVSMSAWN